MWRLPAAVSTSGVSRPLLGLLCAAGLAACASTPRSISQSLEIEVVTPLGAAVSGARCRLSQGGAQWEVVPPARANVVTSSADLIVRCEAAAGGASAEVRLPAQVRGGRASGALIGAGVGVLVGGLLGHSQDNTSKDSMCCGDLGRTIGAALGLGIGGAVGALSADPAYGYPAKVRLTLAP